MFSKDMLEKILKQAAGSKDGKAMKDVKNAMSQIKQSMQQMQAMKHIPGVGQALEQMQQAQDMYAGHLEQSAQEVQTQAKQPTRNTPPVQSSAAYDPVYPINGSTGKRVTEPIVQDSGKQITGGPLLKWVDDNHVEFGSFPQKADGSVLKILWRVLENKDGQLLLLSEHILDSIYWQSETRLDVPKTWKKDDIQRAMIPWENCELRTWLNDVFYNRAFHAAEKNIIVERLNTGNGAYLHRDYVPKAMHKMNGNILTDDSYETYEERGCRDTNDNVFLLSIDEALRFFGKSRTLPGTVWSANDDRTARPTEFLKKRGVILPPHYKWCSITENKTGYWKGNDFIVFEEFTGCMGYFLRSVGSNDIAMHGKNCTHHHGQLSCVRDIGSINAGGVSPPVLNMGVRPAILIRAE